MIGGADIENFLMEGPQVSILEVDPKLKALVAINLATSLEGPWFRCSGQSFEHSVAAERSSHCRPNPQREERKLHDERVGMGTECPV
jgi:hypothetical protein